MALLERIRRVEAGRVIAEAEACLGQVPVSVTDSGCPRSAGGPNDFYSEGDYWWPDADNPDGPYVRRDGESNPKNFSDHRLAMVEMNRRVAALASAWLVTGEARFAEAAELQLGTWFVESGSRMTPHLEYGQAIQGRCTGRGTGIIDTIHLIEAALATSALEPVIPADVAGGVRRWFADYASWMQTHPYGVDEADAKNNHGVWWTAQLAGFARLTGDTAALALCRDRYRTHIENQMAGDGSFPLELARTKPYSYSIFNLEGMAAICQALASFDEAVWSWETEDGRGMRAGVAYLYPFLKDKASWPLPPDVMHDEAWPARHAFLAFGGANLGMTDWVELWEALDPAPKGQEAERNMPIRHPLLWLPVA